jgi:hypothetical protein
VQLTWTPSVGSPLTSSVNLSVDSPYKLIPLTPIPDKGIQYQAGWCGAHPNGNQGFSSVLPYDIFSFLGVNITGNYVSETFTNSVDDYIGNNWPPYVEENPYLTTDGTFSDYICMDSTPGLLTPPSLPPQSPLSSVKMDHAMQAWYVGSATGGGSGVQVQSNTLQRYQDHGRHLSIVSPVR